MEFTTIFFIILSLIAIFYIALAFKSSLRIPILVEFFFIVLYGVFLLFVLFPSLLNLVENVLGISSALNFITYLSIFTLFFMTFLLYRKSEEQRIEITKLVREISYLKKK